MSQTRLALLTVFLLLASTAVRADDNKPNLSLKKISAEGIDLEKGTVDLKVTIAVDNPGREFKLTHLQYRVKLNDEAAAEGKSKKDVEIAAESTSTIELPLTVKLSSLPSVGWSTITDGFNVRYELHTEASVPLFASITRKLKFDTSGELSLSDVVAKWYAKLKDRVAGKP